MLGRYVSAHVLRRSRATDLLEATKRIKAVSRLLGHSDKATTLRYYVADNPELVKRWFALKEMGRSGGSEIGSSKRSGSPKSKALNIHVEHKTHERKPERARPWDDSHLAIVLDALKLPARALRLD